MAAQPPRPRLFAPPADRHLQRRPAAHRLGPGVAGRRQHERAAGARRGPLRVRLWRPGVCLRRRERPPVVALPAAPAAGRGAQFAQDHRPLWRQALHRDVGQPHGRARRAHRTPGVGRRADQPPGNAHSGRPPRRGWRGHAGLCQQHRRRRPDRRDRCRNRRQAVGVRDRRQAGPAGRRHLERPARRDAQGRLGVDFGQLRSSEPPGAVGSRQHLRHRAAARSQAGREQRRAVHGNHAGVRAAHRQAGVVLPAQQERPVRPRLGVRPCDRHAGGGRARAESSTRSMPRPAHMSNRSTWVSRTTSTASTRSPATST